VRQRKQDNVKKQELTYMVKMKSIPIWSKLAQTSVSIRTFLASAVLAIGPSRFKQSGRNCMLNDPFMVTMLMLGVYHQCPAFHFYCIENKLQSTKPTILFLEFPFLQGAPNTHCT